MNDRVRRRAACLVSALLAIVCLASTASLSARPAVRRPTAMRPLRKVTFRQIQPILTRSCVSCHNDARHPENVNLSSYRNVMRSGKRGPIVIPHQPARSNLLLYINGQRQPRMPMRSRPLPARQVSLISRWIQDGARP